LLVFRDPQDHTFRKQFEDATLTQVAKAASLYPTDIPLNFQASPSAQGGWNGVTVPFSSFATAGAFRYVSLAINRAARRGP
jgi:hypothetical protein